MVGEGESMKGKGKISRNKEVNYGTEYKVEFARW